MVAFYMRCVHIINISLDARCLLPSYEERLTCFLNNLDEEQKTKNRPTPAQPPNLNTSIFSARVKLFMIYIYNTGRAQHSSAGKRSAGEAQRATGGRKQATKPGRCPLLTVAACAVVSYHDLNGARRKANSIASASERGGRERRMQT